MKNSEFYKKTIGEYISIQGNDITAIEQDYLEPFISLIRSINMLLVYGCVLLIALDWRIALVIILSSLAAILIPRLMGKSLNNARKNYQNQMGTYVTTITDLLEGFHLINTNTIMNIINRHDETLKTTANKRDIYGRKKSIVLGSSELMSKLIRGLTFATVAVLFCNGEITVGVAVATLSYVSAFIEPIDTILYDVTTMQAMKSVKEKVLSYVNMQNNESKRIKKKLNSEIKFSNVYFSRREFKIENICLNFEKGKKYAIIGKSGAGKSTLLKLLMGYEIPDSGQIMIDGEKLDESDLSEVFSYTAQNEHIYMSGVSDNITVFGSYKEEIAKRFADNMAIRFVLNILQRKDDKNCQGFSGGEKQCIALLRMLAKDSDVILLDEPFSAIDVKNRFAIQNYLFSAKEFQNKTILMVTHDVDQKNLKFFDHIIYIEHSKVEIH